MKRLTLLFFLLAGNSYSLEWLGSYASPGGANSVVVSGNYAYVADINYGLLILDVSDPESPSLVGSTGDMNEARAVAVSGNYAYVADNGFGLRVVDISNPANPVLAGEYEIQTMTPAGTFDRSAYLVEVAGDYVYIAGLSDLLIVDVSDPSAPSLTGMLEDVGIRVGTAGGRKLSASGNYVYIANDTNLMIVDVENPASPSLTGNYMASIGIYDLALTGNHLYLADGGTLQILDISDPASPDSVGQYTASSVIRAVTVFEGRAYISASGLQVVDVGDPAAPALLETFTVPGGALNMDVGPDYLYTVNASALHVLGTGSPQPDLAGNIEFSGDAHALAVSGDYAYLSGNGAGLGGNLWVVDISDKMNPSLAGYLPPNLFGFTQNLAVAGGYVYMAHGNVYIIDVANPASPVLVGDGSNILQVVDMVVSDGYTYLAGLGELEILDVADPLSPSAVGNAVFPGAALSLAVSGTTAYVAAGDSGLNIINISNPASPVLTGTYKGTAPVNQVAASGGLAFVAIGAFTLQAFDVSDPASPVPLGSYQIPGTISDIVVAEGYAYIANGSSRIPVLNLSDPENLTLAHTYYTKGGSLQLSVQGDYLYSSDGWAGLSIISLADSITSSAGRDLFRGRDNLPFLQISSSPFDGGMQISWKGAGGSATSVGIYNPRGERVKFFPELKNPWVYWAAMNFPPGIYFAKVQSGRQFETQPLVLRK